MYKVWNRRNQVDAELDSVRAADAPTELHLHWEQFRVSLSLPVKFHFDSEPCSEKVMGGLQCTLSKFN